MPATLVAEPEQELLLCDGALQVDVRAQLACLHQRPLRLTPKEFALLTLLVRHADRAFSRADLLASVWAYPRNAVETRTVDTHVLRLRKKLGATGERIQTVWGIGYRFASGPPGKDAVISQVPTHPVKSDDSPSLALMDQARDGWRRPYRGGLPGDQTAASQAFGHPEDARSAQPARQAIRGNKAKLEGRA